jgi:hypothetical protein
MHSRLVEKQKGFHLAWIVSAWTESRKGTPATEMLRLGSIKKTRPFFSLRKSIEGLGHYGTVRAHGPTGAIFRPHRPTPLIHGHEQKIGWRMTAVLTVR